MLMVLYMLGVLSLDDDNSYTRTGDYDSFMNVSMGEALIGSDRTIELQPWE